MTAPRPSLAALVLAGMLLGACTPHGVYQDPAAERDFPVRHRMPLVRGPEAPSAVQPAAVQPAAGRLAPAAWAPQRGGTAASLPLPGDAPPLSPGDRVRVEIHLLDDLSGLYEVDLDGSLRLPHLEPLRVAGATAREAAALLRAVLLHREYLRPELARVSIEVQRWAPAQVMVEGAVFNPGTVTVNVRKPEELAQKTLQLSGDYPGDRLLPAALRAAGGVRMDADVDRVRLVRAGVTYRVSLVDYIEGGRAPFIPLIAGDRIIVPSSGHINERLARTSAITPPGIRVFLSNLVTPAGSNSQASVGKESTSLPYGSTLLTGLISANCVGGTGMTNSARYAVLATQNPLTGEAHTIERAIEDLLRDPHRPDINPALQPGDGIACYDSGVTNLRDVARTIADLLIPVRVLLGGP